MPAHDGRESVLQARVGRLGAERQEVVDRLAAQFFLIGGCPRGGGVVGRSAEVGGEARVRQLRHEVRPDFLLELGGSVQRGAEVSREEDVASDHAEALRRKEVYRVGRGCGSERC